MYDQYIKNKIVAILEKELGPLAKGLGRPIPLHFVRAAINNINNFSGNYLSVSNELPEPDELFFSNLLSKTQRIFLAIGKENIIPTKQDIDELLPTLKTGIVDI